MESLITNSNNVNINKLFINMETPVFDRTIKYIVNAIENADTDYVEYLLISTSVNFARYCIENNINKTNLLGPDGNQLFFNYIEEVYGKPTS